MSQTFQVLRCVNCNQFQNHIVKKDPSSKWICKICSTKQSIQKIFGEGTGSNCREIVQNLNITQGKISEEQLITKAQHQSEAEEVNLSNIDLPRIPIVSKWTKYS